MTGSYKWEGGYVDGFGRQVQDRPSQSVTSQQASLTQLPDRKHEIGGEKVKLIICPRLPNHRYGLLFAFPIL
jgi:hypothetical protein